MTAVKSNQQRVLAKQKGFTMVELTIVLAIAAVILAGVFVLLQRNFRKVDINDNVKIITEIASDLQAKYGRTNQYGNITTAIAVQSRTIPAELRVPGTTTATNSYGGAVTVSPVTLTAANDAASLSWANVPQEHCMDLVNSLQNLARRITVAGTIVKPTDSSLNTGTLATSCESADRVSLVLDVGRTGT
jgi:prepilin-type N-terminal cleavage/methylation domain-containing protein